VDQRRKGHHARGAGGTPAARARGHRGGGRVKRRRKPRPTRASKLAARRLPVNGTAVAASAVAPSRGLSRDSPGGDAEPLADSGLRPLLERYCRLAGVKRAALGPDHAELSVPPGERPVFLDRASLRVAFWLSARVVLRAGAGVEEAVVESDVYDLSAGVKVSDDLAAAFRDLEAGRGAAADPSVAADAAGIAAREPAELLGLLLAHLRDKSAERVAARRAVAERELAAELGRLDRYFESVLKEQSDPEAVATVTALAERRRTEEIRRSQVKAVVHPLQLIE